MAIPFSARDISVLVREALQVYADQQAGAAANPTLIGELEQEAAAGMRTIQTLIDDMARQRRIWIANEMQSKLEKPTEIGGTFSLWRWLEVQRTFDAFETWLKTPLVIMPANAETGTPEIAIAPIVVISRRGNPAPGWGVLVQPTAPPTLTPEEQEPTPGVFQVGGTADSGFGRRVSG